jgi:putative transposase
MKKEIAAYVARCDTCCRVKAFHMRPMGLWQPLSVPDWTWDNISMDFITGLTTTPKGNDLIWVIMDRLPNQLTFCQLRHHFEHLSMLRSILQKLFGCMVYQRTSCLTKDHSLSLIFGNIYIKVWVLVWFVVQLTTHKQMGR